MKKYLLILLTILYSCGSRKVEKTQSTTQKEHIVTEVAVTTDTSTVEIKFNYETNTFTIEAKDNLKPFIYKGEKYYNVILKHENKKDNSLYKKDIKVSKIENKQSNTKIKEVVKEKKVDREGYPKWQLYLLLFLMLLFLVARFFYGLRDKLY